MPATNWIAEERLAAEFCAGSLDGGVGMTLTNDIIMSSAPPARAGRAAAISETAYELGTALGAAILGSVLAAVYRRQLLGDTGAATVSPPAQLERASATIAEAFTVADQYPASAAEVLNTRRRRRSPTR
ncbi:MAG: hypothetical protein ACK40Z_13465 [Dietzia sp.]